MLRVVTVVLLACGVVGCPAHAARHRSRRSEDATAGSGGEARASRAFNAAKAQGAPELYAFLVKMPKGGDLHMHLSGAVYAETFIAEAAKQGLCVASLAEGTPPVPQGQDLVRFVPPQHGNPNECALGEVPASEALKRQPLYDALIDSFSMRGFVPSEGVTGHDQFFATFDRFGGLKAFAGEWADEVATRAAMQNEQYLEIMQTPTFAHAAALGYKLGWPEVDDSNHMKVLAGLRQQLLAAGVRDEVPTDREEFADIDAKRDEIERCRAVPPRASDTGSTGSMNGSGTACNVQIRWLYQVLRGFPPQQVFAQTLLGFEVAQAELDSGNPRVVGINFVMPEDGRISMQDYHLQMLMLDYLHSAFPKVRISLHAGELAFGMVPPSQLRFHIRDAVELGHAERIGHGVDLLYETDPRELVEEMARRHIMVEVNLTSNDVILGVKGTEHPLAAYRAGRVPFALSTDDEGVGRIDLTHEYVKAAMEQNLTYADLKRSARTALEHSFIGGESLWAAPDDFSRRTGACEGPIAANSRASGACAALLKRSRRAAMEWELENRFAGFEATVR